MCDLSHQDGHGEFGFIVDVPEIRALIEETERLTTTIASHAERVEALKPAFSRLLAADGWLPDAFASPDRTSGMGGGIGQYALYRADDGSLCLFSLVVPAGVSTPVHDHLAWGLVGVYRGAQQDTTYERLDDGNEPGRASLRIATQLIVSRGDFYALLPPEGDIHYVNTVSQSPSVSIHLLANDTACVWRHRFDPDAGTVTAFRSGYSNVKCRDAASSNSS
jgi:predicted metal-dependent enzyme (double-stranded beta helix superfamily)